MRSFKLQDRIEVYAIYSMAAAEVPKYDLKQLLGDKLLWKDGEAVELQSVTNLAGSYVGIYFSAHW